jgi:SPP1 gp7 family putative phage head morphogenesis protein
MNLEWNFGPDAGNYEDAVQWFLNKGVVSRAEFDALSKVERARAFTAAYIYKADELDAVYEAVSRALTEGLTLRDFVTMTENILERPWHAETVFRTNVLSAYGRGHYESAQSGKGQRPYGEYSAIMDGRTREEHAALNGLVYPLDHPFWTRYWPPWDYN